MFGTFLRIKCIYYNNYGTSPKEGPEVRSLAEAAVEGLRLLAVLEWWPEGYLKSRGKPDTHWGRQRS